MEARGLGVGELLNLNNPALLQARPTRAISWIEPRSWRAPIQGIVVESHYHSHFRDPTLPEGPWIEAFPIKLVELFRGGDSTPSGSAAGGDPRIIFARHEGLKWAQHPLSLTRFPMIPVNYAGDAASFQPVRFEDVIGAGDLSWAQGKIVIVGQFRRWMGFALPWRERVVERVRESSSGRMR